MNLTKAGKGKPSQGERAIFAASIVFIYGVWENYAEQLAIEVVSTLSASIDPTKVPKDVKVQLEKRTAWELSVSPGWRQCWIDAVKKLAVGSESSESRGINTARHGTVRNLLQMAGVPDAFNGLDGLLFPLHLSPASHTNKEALEALVQLRGEIVHTGKVPQTLIKAHVVNWRTYVEALTKGMDEVCQLHCEAALKH
nr:HEPN domain-containing protein [Stenotrophomonas geniculata]